MNLSVHHMLLFAFTYTAYSTSFCGTHRYIYLFSLVLLFLILNFNNRGSKFTLNSGLTEVCRGLKPPILHSICAQHSASRAWQKDTVYAHTFLPSAVGNQSVTYTALLGRERSSFLEVCKDTSLNRTAISTPFEAPAKDTMPISRGGDGSPGCDTWQQERGAAIRHQPEFQHCLRTRRQPAVTAAGIYARGKPLSCWADRVGLHAGHGTGACIAWLWMHCWTLLPFPPQALACLNLFT